MGFLEALTATELPTALKFARTIIIGCGPLFFTDVLCDIVLGGAVKHPLN